MNKLIEKYLLVVVLLGVLLASILPQNAKASGELSELDFRKIFCNKAYHYESTARGLVVNHTKDIAIKTKELDNEQGVALYCEAKFTTKKNGRTKNLVMYAYYANVFEYRIPEIHLRWLD